jgi:hypothetical protein
MSADSKKSESPHELGLPEGPDELVGLTEGGKTGVEIVLIVLALAVLIWIAISIAKA